MRHMISCHLELPSDYDMLSAHNRIYVFHFLSAPGTLSRDRSRETRLVALHGRVHYRKDIRIREVGAIQACYFHRGVEIYLGNGLSRHESIDITSSSLCMTELSEHATNWGIFHGDELGGNLRRIIFIVHFQAHATILICWSG